MGSLWNVLKKNFKQLSFPTSLLNACFYCSIKSSELNLTLYSLALQKYRLIALVHSSVSPGKTKPVNILICLGC